MSYEMGIYIFLPFEMGIYSYPRSETLCLLVKWDLCRQLPLMELIPDLLLLWEEVPLCPSPT